MKKTTYIAIMAALAVATLPLTANARPHHGNAGAVIAGLAVGLGIGILSATASQPATVVYAYEPAPVVYQQPAPIVYQPAPVVYQQPQVVYQEPQVVYQPAPVVYQQPQIIYQSVPQVIYTPPAQTIIYREPVRYFPSYPNYYNHRRNYNYCPPSYNYCPPSRPSSHRGTQAAPYYGPPPSSHRGTQGAPPPQYPRGNGLRRH